MTMTIELGKTYRDKLTGFRGVAVGRTEYLYEDEKAFLQSKVMPQGSPMPAVWFAAKRLEAVVD